MKTAIDTKKEKLYMNKETGGSDNYNGWWYENNKGETVNAVDLDEVVEVERRECEWIEV